MDTKTLDELQGIAEKATPGPWHSDRDEYVWAGERSNPQIVAEARGVGAGLQVDDNAAHIAAFNPQTALTLIAEARKVQELREALELVPQLGLRLYHDGIDCIDCARMKGNGHDDGCVVGKWEDVIAALSPKEQSQTCEYCGGKGEFPAWSASRGDHIDKCQCKEQSHAK